MIALLSRITITSSVGWSELGPGRSARAFRPVQMFLCMQLQDSARSREWIRRVLVRKCHRDSCVLVQPRPDPVEELAGTTQRRVVDEVERLVRLDADAAERRYGQRVELAAERPVEEVPAVVGVLAVRAPTE